MKKWSILLLLSVITITAWQFRPQTPIPISVYTVKQGDVEQIAANSRAGTIKACQRSRLSLRVGGRIDQLFVDEGQRVKTGAALLELQNDLEQVQVELAEAEHRATVIEQERSCDLAALAQREADRAESLAKQSLVSNERVDSLKTEAHDKALQCRQSAAMKERSESSLKLTQVQLEQTRLYAPFGGIVAQINAEIGEFAAPSATGINIPPAIDLIDDSCLYVEAPIDEVEASRVTIGQQARITLDAFRGNVFNGIVGRTAATISSTEKQARTLSIDVLFHPIPEEADLLVGYSADAEVITGLRQNVMRVPTEALLNGSSVYRYNPELERLEAVQVETGLSNWTWTEITQGLELDDLILARIENLSALETARVKPQSL